jgi:hypothetical protein
MDLSRKERKIVESQYQASRQQLQSLSAKVTLAGGLFGLSLVAYAAYKVNDILTRNYLVFLLLMLGLVMLVALLLLGLRPIFERFMNAAFDKLGLKETIDFKWTSGPVVKKTREVHDLSELPPEIANNPEVQKLLQSDSVKKLFEKTTMVTLERPPVVLGSKSAADDAGVSLPAETHSDSKSTTPEIRVFDSPANLPPELANNPQMKSLLARSKGSAVPYEKSAPRVDTLKWTLVVLGFIVLVLSFLTLFAYFHPPGR